VARTPPHNLRDPALSSIRNDGPKNGSAWGRIASGRQTFSPESLSSRKTKCLSGAERLFRVTARTDAWEQAPFFFIYLLTTTFSYIVSQALISFQSLRTAYMLIRSDQN
jgi:hypothetical protein